VVVFFEIELICMNFLSFQPDLKPKDQSKFSIQNQSACYF